MTVFGVLKFRFLFLFLRCIKVPFYLANLLFYIQFISKENNKRDKSHFFRPMGKNNKTFNSILLSHQQAVIVIVFELFYFFPLTLNFLFSIGA